MRRSSKSAATCPEVWVEEQSPVIFQQHAFLLNSTNKDNIIQLLMCHLDHEGRRTIQKMMLTLTLSKSVSLASKQHGPIVVVGDDIDLLVLLSYHQEITADIWLSEAKSAARKASKVASRIINIRTLQRTLGSIGYFLPTTSCSACLQWIRHRVCIVWSWKREGTSLNNSC